MGGGSDCAMTTRTGDGRVRWSVKLGRVEGGGGGEESGVEGQGEVGEGAEGGVEVVGLGERMLDEEGFCAARLEGVVGGVKVV